MTNTKKKQLRAELTNEAKISNINSLINNPNNKLNKEHLKSLINKYGPYAYDIIQKAQAEPANLMQRAGQSFMNTRKAIEYFATEDISTSTLAQAIKKKESDVMAMDANIAKYKLEQTAAEPDKIVAIKKEAEKQRQKADTLIDNREPVVHIVDENAIAKPNNKELKEMNTWAKSISLDSKKLDLLVEKYGTISYQIMRESMHKPSVVMRNMNEKPLGSSQKTVDYFLNNEISTEKLAKALKMKEEDVAKNLPNTIKENQDIIENNAPQQQQITDREPGNMTLNDWVRNYPKDKHPLTKTQLLEAAYTDFGKGEGLLPQVYQDHLGNPTIGVGHLVFLKSKVNDATHIAQYRQKFQALDLEKNGKKLSAEEKGLLYDKMVKNVRETGSIGAPIQYGILSQKGVKKIFKEDLSWAYDVAKKQFPQIDKYPSDLQLTLTHAYFGGYSNIIDETINGKFTKAHKKYNTPEMREFKDLDKDNPQAVQKMLKTMISDINGRNTANVFEQQIINVSDTLSTAQKNYAMASQQNQQSFRIASLELNQHIR